MKRFFNVCVLLVAGFFGGLVGSSVNSAGADQTKDHEPGCDCGPKAVPAGDDEFACGRRGLLRDRRGVRGVAMQMLVR